MPGLQKRLVCQHYGYEVIRDSITKMEITAQRLFHLV